MGVVVWGGEGRGDLTKEVVRHSVLIEPERIPSRVPRGTVNYPRIFGQTAGAYPHRAREGLHRGRRARLRG